MRILLVSPATPVTFWSLKYALEFISKKALLPPLGLLTVAAMLPSAWEKRLVDLATTELRDEEIRWADYVFVGGMNIQGASARQVIDRCKTLGAKIVAGGPLFTSMAEEFDVVDHLVLGEAEVALPRFLKDLQEGRAQHLYRADAWAGGTFVALCDVDEARAGQTFGGFPEAKRYQDFRVMLEKEKGIDAVTVSTPDHTHAIASVMAMSLGKHVYCQKPLTHSIYEARVMAQAAQYYQVQTQMGNQAHAGEPTRRAVELIRAGIIGPVREVYAWTNRPIWPQGQDALKERNRLAQQVKPSDLDWDLWVGPAPMRDYNACYVPFKWRGWWDFGTGALGDMACHIMDMPFWALDLGSPTGVEAESGGQTQETGPDWSTITYHFAARDSVGGGELGAAVGPKAAVAMPAVKFVWYDGRKDGKPNAPDELLERATREAGKTAMATASSRPARTAKAAEKKKKAVPVDDPRNWDVVLVGDDGLMLFKRSATDWIITPGRRAEQFADTPRTVRRVPNEDAEWIAACKGGPKSLSSFDYSGQLTEMVLLGNLAVRLGKKIEWDAAAMKATNAPAADALIRRPYRKGWELPAPAGVGNPNT